MSDPLDTFLQNDGKVDSFTLPVMDAMQMRHTPLLWRQDPEDSFSDWRIILESSEDADTAENNTAVLENQSDVSDVSSTGELAGDAQNINTAGNNNNNHDEIDVLSNEVTPLTTTFHVHRNILAGGSTYFRSLFKKRKNNQTSEHETQTSTIKLKPEVVKSFPAFLDYVYNRNLGILGFERSNAVALRHLAMYFGVDTLLKDISELILLEFKRESLRDGYYNDAKLFNDEKLLQGIRLHRSISNSLLAVISVIFGKLSEKPDFNFKVDNDVLSSWRHVMSYIMDSFQDVYFTLKNSDKFPAIRVTGAGLNQLNGIYNLFGVRDGVGIYTNGFCFLSGNKEMKFWFLYVGYVDRKSENWKEIIFYSVQSDADYPPSTGWCADYSMFLPAPTMFNVYQT